MLERAMWRATPARPPALTGLAAGSGGRATLSPGDRPQRVRSASLGDVAQLEEHRVRIAGVRGSSPLISTTSHDIGIPNLLSGGPMSCPDWPFTATRRFDGSIRPARVR